MSPVLSSAAATRRSPPLGESSRASVLVRVLRNVSAWAFPRPSAIASAKLANSTVNASHTVTDHAKRLGLAIE